MQSPQPFRVDLRGVVDLLSRHIYSSPRVYLRELLQNGRDAIFRRKELCADEGSSDWGIRLYTGGQAGLLSVHDDGIGLTRSESEELLATIGASSKRDIFDLPGGDYIGQFGIGLLSCFMICDRVVVRSRSALGAAPVEWVGDVSGTFMVRELVGVEADATAVGTVVELIPRPDDAALTRPDRVVALARAFGQYLPVPIRVHAPGGTRLVNSSPVWQHYFDENDVPDAILELGTELLGAAPLAAFPLADDATSTRGTAFVCATPIAPGAHAAHRVYAHHMLVSERVDDLLPDWAIFVRCVVDSAGIALTASREAVVEDAALAQLRTGVGEQIKSWLRRVGTFRTDLLALFTRIHNLPLKALVVADDDVGSFVVPWLTVETTAGEATIGDLTREHHHLLFADSIDEFARVTEVDTGGDVVINAGYVLDSQVMRRLPELIPGITVERVTHWDRLSRLAAPPLTDRATVHRFASRAAWVLAESEVGVIVRCFAPVEVPALHLVDDAALRAQERRAVIDSSSAMWAGILGSVEVELEPAVNSGAVLCFNHDCALVRGLYDLRDDDVFARSIELLYVQTLLTARRPLTSKHRQMLLAAVDDIVRRAAGNSPA